VGRAPESCGRATLPAVPAPFRSLDFIYAPSRDVAAERDHLEQVLGARAVFAIEAFGARVAMLELSPEPPALLLADHLEGTRPVLVHRVDDLDQAMAQLVRRGWQRRPTFQIPHGPCCSFDVPGGHRIAIYEATRPGMTERFAGRRDF
jgi:hypothetical protein